MTLYTLTIDNQTLPDLYTWDSEFEIYLKYPYSKGDYVIFPELFDNLIATIKSN